MSFVATPEGAAKHRCPLCDGPAACALGIRHWLLCRCDAHDEPRWWKVDNSPSDETELQVRR